MLLPLAPTIAASLTPPPAPADLAISLVFGAGQVVVGSALAWRGLASHRWRRLPLFTLALLGIWVVCSGIAELIVSGLETAARAWGRPTPSAIAAVRDVADASLLVVALALLAVVALYLAFLWRGTIARAKRDHPA
jgi:hypothetical protein